MTGGGGEGAAAAPSPPPVNRRPCCAGRAPRPGYLVFPGTGRPRVPRAIEPRPVEFYEPDEAAALFDAIERLSGPKWRTLAELGMQVGLRPGEIFGLHGYR